ncbi:hypothetical protein AX14_014020 [Amanita brunnescens Koide BX004]|nr:hypothetical protein AX14_014020 [Amanita brunnescens Koide BX004]
MSTQEAIVQMAPFASLLLVFKQLFGSVGARLLPGFGFEPVLPKWIAPVYFPAWVIDAELEASITQGDTQRTVLTQFFNAYLPGNNFEFMPLVSLWDKNRSQYQLVPFTSELERQYDANVQCLPYSISPFSVLDIAKNWPHGDVEIGDGMFFSPTSIKPTLVCSSRLPYLIRLQPVRQIAAYPVLVPFYFAQYQTELPNLKQQLDVTIFIEAFAKKGRIFVHKYHQQLRHFFSNGPVARLMPLMDDHPVIPVRGGFAPFARIADMGIPQAPNFNNVLLSWLDERLQTSETLYPLLAQLSRDSPTLQGKDERVRNYMNAEDRDNVCAYLAHGCSLSSLKMAAEVTESASQMFHAGLGDVRKSLQEKVDEVEKARRESLPSWWKEWEERERGATKHVPEKQS